jgi:hypothetical protein
MLERFEDRLTPSTFTVTNTDDGGPGSLRQAMLDAEATANVGGPDQIQFDIPGSGVHTLTPAEFLPIIHYPVIIDGYTQPGASPNTLAVGDNAVLKIEIDCSAISSSEGLFIFSGGGGSAVRGLVINHDDVNAFLIGPGFGFPSDNNTIAGNFIGTDVTGAVYLAGTLDDISIEGGVGNRIGGLMPADRNVIVAGSVNSMRMISEGVGPQLPVHGTVVEGNYFGVNAAGTAALNGGNHTQCIFPPGGDLIQGNVIVTTDIAISLGNTNNNFIQDNLIGTNATGSAGLNAGQGIVIGAAGAPADHNTITGNLISGGGIGISITSTSLQGLVIQGNKIGTDITGTTAIPNSGDGIHIFGNSPPGGAVIGGTNPGDGNMIAFNSGAGVAIDQATGWSVLGNSIFANGGLGIDLNDGAIQDPITRVNPNDLGDGDAGPNNDQNYPVITSATAGSSTTITGTLNSTPNTLFRLEFFASDVADPSGFGEGQTFIGFRNVTTDGNGDVSFTAGLQVAVIPGQVVTATATDPDGNTSEFSATMGVMGVLTAVGADAGGGSEVKVFDAGGKQVASFFAFDPAFPGGIRVAVGDVNGDGVPDLIVAAGPGGGAHVKIIDGTKLSMVDTNGQIDNAALLGQFFAYSPFFTGGVFVAFGISNGLPQIITGAGAGGGPHVKVIDGAEIKTLQNNGEIADSALVAQFYAYSPFFNGGVRVAAADLNSDGVLDIVTGAGPGGGPHVKAINGTKLGQLQNNAEISDAALIGQFYAYTPTSAPSGGVYVAATDIGGHPIIITGDGPVSSGAVDGPRVKVIDATKLNLLDSNGEPAGAALLGNYFAYDPAFGGGVSVGAAELNGDGVADIVTGAGPGGGPHIKVIDGTQLSNLQPNREIADAVLLDSFFAFDSAFTGGVFVGAGA